MRKNTEFAHNKVLTECVCPFCGQIHNRAVELDYVNAPFVWRQSGILVRGCLECENDKLGKKLK